MFYFQNLTDRNCNLHHSTTQFCVLFKESNESSDYHINVFNPTLFNDRVWGQNIENYGTELIKTELCSYMGTISVSSLNGQRLK